MSDKFEINENLYDYDYFDVFEDTILEVRAEFQELFGEEVLNRLPLYVDNSLKGSGYTPGIDVVLHSYMNIKLHIDKFWDTELIIYQFAHEMLHFTYRCLIGIDKKHADVYEESMCSAMALCFLNGNCRNFRRWCKHVQKLKNEGYRKGYDVAKECNFDSVRLRNKILSELDDYRRVAL